MRALIIDDSAVMRKVIERSLRQAGIEQLDVLQAGNGAEAIELLRKTPTLDLILSDINMPGMDGLAFLEQRAAENLSPGTPIVMITTEASEPLVLRALAAGARGYLCKPFTSEQIKARILPLVRSAHHAHA